MKKIGLQRMLIIWLGSFLLIATLLFFYFGVALTPLLGGGALALVLTLGRYFLSEKSQNPR